MGEEPSYVIRELADSLRVPPGSRVNLPGRRNPSRLPAGLTEEAGERALAETTALLADYQARLAAQDTFGMLVIIQGIDAAGKDSTIKHVMSGVNPAGVAVHSFKVPSTEEWSHDFLWRFAKLLPRRGQIAIFNRSHYEEVLVVRVHPEILDNQHLPEKSRGTGIWRRRYQEINNWEKYLTDNGIHVVKVFLNVSKEEQRKRFLDRIDKPEKNWKFSESDVSERRHWDSYQTAFSEMLSHTSTKWAPWYVVPADHKWFARLAVSAIMIDELRRIDPKFPTVSKETSAALAVARQQLLAEGPRPPRGHGERTL